MERYYFALAERLHRTRAELLDGISSAELAQWMAYDELAAKEAKKAQDMKNKGMIPRGFGRMRGRGRR